MFKESLAPVSQEWIMPYVHVPMLYGMKALN